MLAHQAAAMLAHQGGWDEALFVVAPIVVVATLLWIAKRRVERAAAERRPEVERRPELAHAPHAPHETNEAGADRRPPPSG